MMWWQWVCSRWKLLLHYSTWPKEQVWVCSINDAGCDGVCVCGDLQRCRESLRCSLPGRVWSAHPGWPPHEAPLGSGWTQLQMHTQSHAHNTKQSNKHSHSEHRGKQRKVLININGNDDTSILPQRSYFRRSGAEEAELRLQFSSWY